MTPGRKPSISTSAVLDQRSTTSRPAGDLQVERRPSGGRAAACRISVVAARQAEVDGLRDRSMRMTSAPMSASSMAQNGAGPMPAISTTRNALQRSHAFARPVSSRRPGSLRICDRLPNARLVRVLASTIR